MSKLTKDEALREIDRLKEYVEGYKEEEYIPKVGETVVLTSKWNYISPEIGDIAIVMDVMRGDLRGVDLYNPRWEVSKSIYLHFNQIKKLETTND